MRRTIHTFANIITLFLISFVLIPVSKAEVYYIDFTNGSDSNSGTSIQTPFKHSPGDLSATSLASSTILSPGDKVIFKGDVEYKGTIAATSSGTGDSDSNRIIYDGDSGSYVPRWALGTGKAVIHGESTRNSGFIISQKHYLTINNFEIKNHLCPAYYGAIHGTSDYISDYITITNCNIHDNGSSLNYITNTGWGILWNGSHWKILNNIFSNNYAVHIVSYNGSFNEIAKNTFGDGSIWGINPNNQTDFSLHDNIFANIGQYYWPCTGEDCPHLDGIIMTINSQGFTTSNVRIYNNIFYYDQAATKLCMTAAMYITTGGITSSQYEDVMIYNNSFSNVPATNGIISFYGATRFIGLSIYNNSFNNPSLGPYCIGFQSLGSSLSYDTVKVYGNSFKTNLNTIAIMKPSSSLYWTNIEFDYNNYSTPGQAGSYPFCCNEVGGYINWSSWLSTGYDMHSKGPNSDPLYANADDTHWDLSLLATSPLKDAFPTLSAPSHIFTNDIIGVSRPQGLAWDIGAYEYPIHKNHGSPKSMMSRPLN